MTKEILLSISGLHFVDGENRYTYRVTAGDYYNRGGKHYILYDEVVEGHERTHQQCDQDRGKLSGNHQKRADEHADGAGKRKTATGPSIRRPLEILR